MRQAHFYTLCTVLCGLLVIMASAAMAKGGLITIALGKSEVVSISKNAADVLVSDPEIADAGSMRQGEVHITGLKIGDTNILVFDDAGKKIQTLNVHVNANTDAIQQSINEALPNARVTVKAVGQNIVLEGKVPSADDAYKAKDIAIRFLPERVNVVNRLSVADNQQVMIRVKVVEVSRTVLNELGLETNLTSLASGNFSGSKLATTPSLGLTVDPSFGVGSLIYNTGSTGPLELIMRALERDGLVNTLAQPNLTAISGENARFLAGGEFPIPSQRDQNGNIQYEYKPFGVSLAFKPVVLSSGRINLQVSTEVSEISPQLTLQLPGVTVPSFSVRRAETTVELASGGSLMLAGLIQSQAISRMNQLPGIKEVPVLGALASSESFSRNESELLVMITAYNVEPFADKQAVRVSEQNNKTPQREPLNETLVERLAAAYGRSVFEQAPQTKPVGYILE